MAVTRRETIYMLKESAGTMPPTTRARSPHLRQSGSGGAHGKSIWLWIAG